MTEIENKRAQLKKKEYQRRKKYYADLEKNAISKVESKFKIDYQKKFDKARKRYETSFDKKTLQLVKNSERKETGKKVVKYKSKKKDIGWLDVKKIIQKWVRLRDSDQYWYWNCIVTWEKLHRKRWNWWHYISASYKKTALNPDNIHLQSPSSNKSMSMWDKEADKHKARYRENLIKKIWIKRVESLEIEHETWKYQTFWYNKAELREIYDRYAPLVKELESKIKPLPLNL